MSIHNEEPLITVIVPVFQVEKYLQKCVSSILAQTYHNLEIILVDDGSFDNSPIICEICKVKDIRIKVIHKENGGLSQARNVGLKLAKGDFVSFVDSDDWIEPKMYEVLMSAMLADSRTDIAVCNYTKESNDSQMVINDVESSNLKKYSPEEALRLIINAEGYIKSVVWNKLYRRTLLTNTFFIEGKIYEDTLWTAKVIGNAKLIICVDKSLYHYLYRPESLSHNNQQIARRLQDLIEMNELRLEYIHEYYPSLEKLAIGKFQILCCREYLGIGLENIQYDADGKIRNELYRHFCRFRMRNIFFFDKFWMILCRIFFLICPCLLAKIYKFIKTIQCKYK